MIDVTLGVIGLAVVAAVVSWILEPVLMDRPEKYRDVDRLARKDRQ